jgi:hypothetical protein
MTMSNRRKISYTDNPGVMRKRLREGEHVDAPRVIGWTDPDTGLRFFVIHGTDDPEGISKMTAYYRTRHPGAILLKDPDGHLYDEARAELHRQIGAGNMQMWDTPHDHDQERKMNDHD